MVLSRSGNPEGDLREYVSRTGGCGGDERIVRQDSRGPIDPPIEWGVGVNTATFIGRYLASRRLGPGADHTEIYRFLERPENDG